MIRVFAVRSVRVTKDLKFLRASPFLMISSTYNDDYDLTVRMPILVRAFVLRSVDN